MAAEHRCPEHQAGVLPAGTQVGGDEEPPGCQGAFARLEVALADGIEEDVVRLTVRPVVIAGVVDDLVGSERPHQVDVLGRAHRRHVRLEVPRELHRGSADRPGGAVDEDAPALVHASSPKAGEGEDHPVTDGGGLLVGHARGLEGQRGVLAHADVLRVGSEALRMDSEHLVPGRELRDRRPDRLDLTGELGAEDRLRGVAQAAEGPDDIRLTGAEPAVGPVDRGGVDLDEDLVVRRHRLRHISELQHLGGPIPRVDHRAHRFTSSSWGRVAARTLSTGTRLGTTRHRRGRGALG